MNTHKPDWINQLKEAAQAHWSGRVLFTHRDEQVGTIIFIEGRIGWAVCRYQPEDLGTFLCRVGKVDKEQLRQAREVYEQKKGQRKLGALLEELGFVKRPILRRCLLLHIRMAVGCLLRNHKLQITGISEHEDADEECTFALDEVISGNSILPPMLTSTHPPDLSDLSAIAGFGDYRAFLVVDREGQLLTSHRKDLNVSLDVLAVEVVKLMEIAQETAQLTGTGGLGWLISDCTGGALLNTWLDENSQLMASMLLDETANIGMAKYKLSAALENILARIEAERFETLEMDDISDQPN